MASHDEDESFDDFEDARSHDGEVPEASSAVPSIPAGSLEDEADEFFAQVKAGTPFKTTPSDDRPSNTSSLSTSAPAETVTRESPAVAESASATPAVPSNCAPATNAAESDATASSLGPSADSAARDMSSESVASVGGGGAAATVPEPDGGDAEVEGEEAAVGGYPDLIAADGHTIRRRKRSVDEADELEDGKKDVSMATACKEEGNRHFGKGDYETAIACYSEALRYIPRGKEHDHQRSVYFCNRAACYLHVEKFDEVIYDCDRALENQPLYTKALLRRSSAFEKIDKLDEAKADIDAWLAIEPSSKPAKQAHERLVKMITERDEKLKEEMLGKLKEMGNWVLGKFGLSMDNFKAVKDPNTGSYSISFQQ